MNRTILVCDDDELLVELLTFRLENKGYKVLVARNGAEAIALASQYIPDAIILDMMMPVMDGQQVLRRLREAPETAGIPVVMLTARKQERDIVDAFGLGASDYLVKPFIPEELMTRLARLLAAPK
ncbi:response regulator transcription factor [Sphingomonas koreensis]|uniref:Response regulator n=1 Tax=Sphingomonas koreensis TaxID=93064 RepID=A0A1L6JB81_9SPHN|nr:response regulator [Sphingomonas koreensis]APR53182.1 response regulator [Sphingomonas koreensis]